MTDFKGLYQDYAPDGTEDDEMLAIKQRVAALDVPSKNIWLLYCEESTYTSVARILHSSPPTVKRKIEAIRKRILGNV